MRVFRYSAHGLINEFSLHKPMGLNYHFVIKPMGLISSKYVTTVFVAESMM
jgi:hypothetical protein